ncbi:DUF4097 domain-containing protein [Christensenellaceae bacterium OttesenSCG-928-K19]|nr:DUF4097 domain-containing protein [Christensenellaceae bacterium OttesenSCG-928-K19]
MARRILTIVLIVIIIALVAVMLWGMGIWSPTPELARENTWLGINNWGISCNGAVFGTGPLPNDAEQGLEVEKPVAEINGVLLSFAHERIEVVETDSNMVRIEQTSDQQLSGDYIMRYGMLDGRLVAQSGTYGHMNAGVSPGSKITLYVPKGSNLSLNIDTASGRVAVNGGAYGNMEIDTASGEVSVESVTAKNVKIDTASGGVMVDKTDCSSIYVSVASGNINVSANATGIVELDSASGEVTFKGTAEAFEADTASGSVNAEIGGLRTAAVDSASGSVRIACTDADTLREIDVDTASGEVTIELPENDGFEVDYDTASGGLRNEFEMVGDLHKNGGIDISVDTVSGGLNILKK